MTNEQCFKWSRSINSATRKLLQSLLDTDYKRFNYDIPEKVRIEIVNKELAMKLNEINFKKFKYAELVKLCRNLGLRDYEKKSKQVLIEKIELVKKQF